jgi:hypothetical protein
MLSQGKLYSVSDDCSIREWDLVLGKATTLVKLQKPALAVHVMAKR